MEGLAAVLGSIVLVCFFVLVFIGFGLIIHGILTLPRFVKSTDSTRPYQKGTLTDA